MFIPFFVLRRGHACKNTLNITGHAIVTLYVAYSIFIGRVDVRSAATATRPKDHKPKHCLSVTIYLYRIKTLVETK